MFNSTELFCVNVAEIKLMPSILGQLKQHMPKLKIHLHSLSCLEQIQALKNAELDLTFTRFELKLTVYRNIHVLDEQIYLVGLESLHPQDRTLRLKELRNHSLIMCQQNASPVFYDKLNTLLQFDQLDEQVLWVTNVLQHINLINMGMGLSFVPECLLKFLNEQVKVIRVDIELPQLSLYATYHRDSNNSALKMITQALCKN